MAVSPDGRSVYATTHEGVSQYSAGPDGALTPKSPPLVAAGSNPFGIAVSPDGQSVYVANIGFIRGDGSVSQYSAGPDGALSPKAPPAVGIGSNPSAVAISPDGQNAYVISRLNNGVSQYSVGPGGALSFTSGVGAGEGPGAVVVSPDGASVYVTNSFDSTVSQYSIGAGGALSARSPPTVPAGIDPEGVAVGPAARVPTSKDQCKNGGWRNFTGFKNQGECVAFVE